MYKLSVTELADADLDEIIHYIAFELEAPQAASDFVDAVESCYERIRLNPMSFEISRNPHLAKEGYRRVVTKNYIMLYKICQNNSEVTTISSHIRGFLKP